MYLASSTAGGMCFAFPDTCNTPSASGVTPITYPNIGQCSNADETSSVVQIEDMDAMHKGSEIPSSSGDEAGVSGGTVSGENMGKVVYDSYSSVVEVEGDEMVTHLGVTGQNGDSSSNATGAQVSPSQTLVIVNG